MEIAIAILALYVVYHIGHGHRGVNLYWSSLRGPWISIPGPFGTRIGRRL